MHTLLDTATMNDALAAGYEAPEEDGLKITFEAHRDIGTCAIITKHGQHIELIAQEVGEAIRALTAAKARTETLIKRDMA